jgi:hypothetical protein
VRHLKEFVEKNRDMIPSPGKIFELLLNAVSCVEVEGRVGKEEKGRMRERKSNLTPKQKAFILPPELLNPCPVVPVYDTLGISYSELLLHFHTYEIADQLTRIDWNVYSVIPKE